MRVYCSYFLWNIVNLNILTFYGSANVVFKENSNYKLSLVSHILNIINFKDVTKKERLVGQKFLTSLGVKKLS